MVIRTRTRVPTSEAEAARRFLEASRNVEQAFRAARVHDGAPAAQTRLDLALDELARAEQLFDTVAKVQGRRRNRPALNT